MKNSETVQSAPRLHFLQEYYDQFENLTTDSKEVLWANEFSRENIFSTDLILQQLANELLKTIQSLIDSIKYEVVEKRSFITLDLIRKLRESDLETQELLRMIATTHNMSQELLERITGIITATSSVPTQNSDENNRNSSSDTANGNTVNWSQKNGNCVSPQGLNKVVKEKNYAPNDNDNENINTEAEGIMPEPPNDSKNIAQNNGNESKIQENPPLVNGTTHKETTEESKEQENDEPK